ncbi:hypothetical protein [Streptomyces fuscichromogenes]|uniref:Uncharacterized protein n=1 Tax=Streptomyces fuscichromogenes TaxID=1324013 RepID=A0A917XC85_9ACTN|nr:hypothetical protein [Streptomyces fuscichromogenes]GGN05140.1 hypothetical protein GCM10011578_028740 [Streptomyces fuscichromogenes]
MSQWALPPFFDIFSAEFPSLKAGRAAGNWAASVLSGALDCRYLFRLRGGVGTATGTNGHGRPGAAGIAVTGRRPCEDGGVVSMPAGQVGGVSVTVGRFSLPVQPRSWTRIEAMNGMHEH